MNPAPADRLVLSSMPVTTPAGGRRKRFSRFAAWGVMLALAVATLPAAAMAAEQAGEEGWMDLFNGRDLEGWTVKVAKHPLGANHATTPPESTSG